MKTKSLTSREKSLKDIKNNKDTAMAKKRGKRRSASTKKSSKKRKSIWKYWLGK